MKIKTYLSLTLVLLLTLCPAIAQTTASPSKAYDGSIRVESIRVDQTGETLYIDFDIIMEDLKVKSPKGIDLIPILISSDQVYTLPKVSIMGKNQYLVYERKLSLMNKQETESYEKLYAIEKNRKRKTDIIQYTYTLPYQPWMRDAELNVQIDQCGCGQAELMDVVHVGKVSLEPMPYTLIPHMAYVQPEAEEVKRREVQAECFLDFEVNKVNIRPHYMNNPRELAKIHSMIDELKEDPSIQVNRLDIIGYASPEGTLQGNKRLSEGRAQALRDYLAQQYEFPRGLYHIIFGGENWKGLLSSMESLQFDYKEEVLDILEDMSITDEQRKTKLKSLRTGIPYRYLLKEIYPSLRVALCKVGYNIKNFDLAEAREIIKNRPQNLSLNEMFHVANSYPEGSQEFIDVFETAVRLYPESGIANLNAATSSVTHGDLSLAERYLQRVDPKSYPAEYNNTLGTIAMLREDYETAQNYLEEAARQGSEAAKLNLNELKKKKESIRLIQERKEKRR